MPLGINVFSRKAPIVKATAHKDKMTLHFIMNIAAVAMVVGGFFAIWYNKAMCGKDHFTTWHGLAGVITTGLITAQGLGSSAFMVDSLADTLAKAVGGKAKLYQLHRTGFV